MAATANTTIQLAVPDGLRGRVMSVYTTIFAGSTPVGGPLMGGLASAFGVAVSLAIGGVLSAVVGIGAFAWIRRAGPRSPAAVGRGPDGGCRRCRAARHRSQTRPCRTARARADPTPAGDRLSPRRPRTPAMR